MVVASLPSLSGSPRVAIRATLRIVRVTLALVALFLVVGNLVIAGAWQLESRVAPAPRIDIPGVANLHMVDERVWRSAAPSSRAFDDLSRAGVRTIVDLRAEDNIEVDTGRLARLGIRYVHLPIRDGQSPKADQVAAFLATVRHSSGITLVHCGAGVGRTGAMAAAYLVASGEADGRTAMQRNLAIGPPSLEQLAFAARLGTDRTKPPIMVVAASRVLDAPRRLWSRYGL
jgi:protein tyrosine phosphatase (PTP) superfamily phosphohydrolase (DUF442 family)